MKVFLTRTVSAIVFAAIMFTGILWNQWSLFVLVVLINFLLLHEFYKIFEIKFSFKGVYYVVLGTLILILSLIGLLFKGGYIFAFIIPAIVFLVFVLEMANSKAFSMINTAIAITGWVYISFPLTLFALMGNVFEGFSFKYTLPLLCFVWINDIFAYIVGSLIGKTKIAPGISPKKTAEGLAGGIIATLATAFVFISFYPDLAKIHWFVLALISSIFGIFGDLIESKMKRDANIKDSGSIMPGHGGLLDRFDAFLFVTPFYFIYLIVFVL